MKVIAVANQKGGAGKTTTSHALSARLYKLGFKVLDIDLDPQGNLSSAFGVDNYNKPTIYNLMKNEVTAKEVLQQAQNGVDVIPSNIMLAGCEQELSPLARNTGSRNVLNL